MKSCETRFPESQALAGRRTFRKHTSQKVLADGQSRQPPLAGRCCGGLRGGRRRSQPCAGWSSLGRGDRGAECVEGGAGWSSLGGREGGENANNSAAADGGCASVCWYNWSRTCGLVAKEKKRFLLLWKVNKSASPEAGFCWADWKVGGPMGGGKQTTARPQMESALLPTCESGAGLADLLPKKRKGSCFFGSSASPQVRKSASDG
jgi:hypothetical protein